MKKSEAAKRDKEAARRRAARCRRCIWKMQTGDEDLVVCMMPMCILDYEDHANEQKNEQEDP